MVKLGYGGLVSDLSQFFATAPVASKSDPKIITTNFLIHKVRLKRPSLAGARKIDDEGSYSKPLPFKRVTSAVFSLLSFRV